MRNLIRFAVLLCCALFYNHLYSQIVSPETRFISTTPGETWERSLVSANATVGVNVLSNPLDEIVIKADKFSSRATKVIVI